MLFCLISVNTPFSIQGECNNSIWTQFESWMSNESFLPTKQNSEISPFIFTSFFFFFFFFLFKFLFGFNISSFCFLQNFLLSLLSFFFFIHIFIFSLCFFLFLCFCLFLFFSCNIYLFISSAHSINFPFSSLFSLSHQKVCHFLFGFSLPIYFF